MPIIKGSPEDTGGHRCGSMSSILTFSIIAPARFNLITTLLFSSGHRSIFINQERIDRIDSGGRMGVREADQGSIHYRNPAFS
jgi:hypothetical protein